MKILVLAGGISPERDVSLDSGRCVFEALRERGHDVELLDPACVPLSEVVSSDWDVAIPMVHGTGGEDGVLQSELVSLGITYVGSSPEASELTFDKIRTNTLLGEHRIRVPGSVVVTKHQAAAERMQQVQSLASQVVTKPPRQGSSIGVTIVTDLSGLDDGLSAAFRYDDRCLVEQYIRGSEVTVPVIDGKAFPPIEIRPAAQWYTYEAKYVDDATDYLVGVDSIPQLVLSISEEACQICGVTGIARVDFIVDERQQPWLLEVNTIPGMTSHSLVPKSAAAKGLSLGELCEAAIATVLGDS